LAERKYTAESLKPRIDQFLGNLVRNGGFDLEFEVAPGEAAGRDFENPDVTVLFSGQDVDLLLANKAEMLLALEYLTMEMLRIPQNEHDRLCFDANDYRALRIEELRMSAETAAQRVKNTGIPYEFGPMSSRERRIIHLALRHETEVRSESAGVGPGRHAVIYPANMPSAPQTAALPPPRRPYGRR
jgi:spoIIIJ-associated protein